MLPRSFFRRVLKLLTVVVVFTLTTLAVIISQGSINLCALYRFRNGIPLTATTKECCSFSEILRIFYKISIIQKYL